MRCLNLLIGVVLSKKDKHFYTKFGHLKVVTKQLRRADDDSALSIEENIYFTASPLDFTQKSQKT